MGECIKVGIMKISTDESGSMPVKYAGLPGKTWDELKQKFKSIVISPELMAEFQAAPKKWVYQSKYDGMEGIGFKPFSKYALDDGGKAIKEKAGEPSKQKSKALVGGVPKVFPKVLENPRSEWGKALKEKLKKK